MQPAYSRASRHSAIWLLCWIAAFGGMIASMIALSVHPATKNLGPWMLPIGITPMILAIVLSEFVRRLLLRARYRKLGDQLERMGFTVKSRPTPEDRNAWFETLSPLHRALDLRGKADGLKWLARRETRQGSILAFEYEYFTGSGKAIRQFIRTVVIWPAGVPDAAGKPAGWLAAFILSRLGFFERRALRKSENTDSSLAGVAREWAVYGDTATGLRFLNDAVRHELARSPRGESWCVGGEQTCCSFRHELDAANLAKFLDRSQAILKLAGDAGS